MVLYVTLLHYAIMDHNEEQVLWLLDHGADINGADENGNSPLMLAIANNLYPHTVKALLDRGADPFARNRDGSTALAVALDQNSPEDVENLLARYVREGKQAQVDAGLEHGRLALLL